MSIKSLIEKKRDGLVHSSTELAALMTSILDGTAKDYQISAWLMAVYFRGMTEGETVALVEAMWKSGRTLQRNRSPLEATRRGDRAAATAAVHDFYIDKHSTGGVGDKTSLILVPLVSSVCERLMGKDLLKIPMISGRSLGFTGGTLDKLESVPGFRSRLSEDEAMALLTKQGFFMMGQTDTIAPVDRVLYSLRDATSTVNSLPLIVSSILSKKLSENLDALIFDVKFGAGALFPEPEKARELAMTLITVAQKLGLAARALLTRMDEPLGRAVGCFLEIEECAQFLTGEYRDPGLEEVTMQLAVAMVESATGGEVTGSEALRELELEISTRRAWNLFVQMLEAQGGNWDLWTQQNAAWKRDRHSFVYRAPTGGYLAQMDARVVAEMLEVSGGLRPFKESELDPMVGILVHKKIGDVVNQGEPLIEILARDRRHDGVLESLCRRAASVVSMEMPRKPWVAEVLS